MALQQGIGRQVRRRGARQLLMEAIQVAGAHLKPPLPGPEGGPGRPWRCRLASGCVGHMLRHPLGYARMLRRQRLQKVTDRLTEQPQARQHRDVADHVGGVKALPGDLRSQGVEHATPCRLEGLPAAVEDQMAIYHRGCAHQAAPPSTQALLLTMQ